jgi:hypothetical protein
MMEFFTSLVAQAIRPLTEVFPVIAAQYGPGPDVPAADVFPEPPALDSTLQSTPGGLAYPVDIPQMVQPVPDQNAAPLPLEKETDGSDPVLPSIQPRQASPDVGKNASGSAEEQDVTYTAEAFKVSDPGRAVLAPPISSSAEGKEIGQTIIGRTGDQPTGRDILPPQSSHPTDDSGSLPSSPSAVPIERNKAPVTDPSDPKGAIEQPPSKDTERYSNRTTRRTDTVAGPEPGTTPLSGLQNGLIQLKTDPQISNQGPHTPQPRIQQIVSNTPGKESNSWQPPQNGPGQPTELPLLQTHASGLPQGPVVAASSDFSSAEDADPIFLLEGSVPSALAPHASLKTGKMVRPAVGEKATASDGETLQNRVLRSEKDPPALVTGDHPETRRRSDSAANILLSTPLPIVPIGPPSPVPVPPSSESAERPAAVFPIADASSSELKPGRPDLVQARPVQKKSDPAQMQSTTHAPPDMSLSKVNPPRLPGESAAVKPAILPISPGDRTLPVEKSLSTGADTRQSLKRSGKAEPSPDWPDLHSDSFIRPVIAAAPLPGDGTQGSADNASESSATTVRLTIGRIVVKAVPPASSTPSAPVSRRQASVSLSDYLARHRRSQ